MIVVYMYMYTSQSQNFCQQLAGVSEDCIPNPAFVVLTDIKLFVTPHTAG